MKRITPIKFREPFDTINNSLPVVLSFHIEYYFFLIKQLQGFWGLLNRTQVSRLVSELRCAPISKQFVAVYIKLTNPNESPYYTNIKITSQSGVELYYFFDGKKLGLKYKTINEKMLGWEKIKQNLNYRNTAAVKILSNIF